MPQPHKIGELVDQAIKIFYEGGLDSAEATEWVVGRSLDEAVFISDMPTWCALSTEQRKLRFRASEHGRLFRNGVQNNVLDRCRGFRGRRAAAQMASEAAQIPLFLELEAMVGLPVQDQGGKVSVRMTKFGDLTRDNWLKVEEHLAEIAARTERSVQWMLRWRTEHEHVWAEDPSLKAAEVHRLAAKGPRPPDDDRPRPRA
jgi:hypothetical protein